MKGEPTRAFVLTRDGKYKGGFGGTYSVSGDTVHIDIGGENSWDMRIQGTSLIDESDKIFEREVKSTSTQQIRR